MPSQELPILSYSTVSTIISLHKTGNSIPSILAFLSSTKDLHLAGSRIETILREHFHLVDLIMSLQGYGNNSFDISMILKSQNIIIYARDVEKILNEEKEEKEKKKQNKETFQKNMKKWEDQVAGPESPLSLSSPTSPSTEETPQSPDEGKAMAPPPPPRRQDIKPGDRTRYDRTLSSVSSSSFPSSSSSSSPSHLFPTRADPNHIFEPRLVNPNDSFPSLSPNSCQNCVVPLQGRRADWAG